MKVFALIVLVLASVIADPASAQVPVEAKRYQRDFIRAVRSVWGLDAPVAAMAAQVHQESQWKTDARSPVGATGAAQFMPATATWICGRYPELPPGCNSLDPRWAFAALATYDKHLWDRIIGAANSCERMAFALQGYNSGPGWVNKRRKLMPPGDKCLNAACNINPGVAPANQREAENYPRLILLVHAPKYMRAGWGDSACA